VESRVLDAMVMDLVARLIRRRNLIPELVEDIKKGTVCLGGLNNSFHDNSVSIAQGIDIAGLLFCFLLLCD
jgi:hypothetical protein